MAYNRCNYGGKESHDNPEDPVQHQLGHASIQTTLDRYGHLISDVNTEQAKKLDGILGFEGVSNTPLEDVRRMLESEDKTDKPNPIIYLPVEPLKMVAYA